ncbi:hypothetical protein ACLB2K_000223 [Fragaria x ananassa]
MLQPSWPVFLGVLLRSEAICLSFRLSGYFVWSVIFLCLLRLGQFLLSHALFFPDLTFSSSNLVFSLRVANGGGSYLFQSADSCKYAPRSLNRVGWFGACLELRYMKVQQASLAFFSDLCRIATPVLWSTALSWK